MNRTTTMGRQLHHSVSGGRVREAARPRHQSAGRVSDTLEVVALVAIVVLLILGTVATSLPHAASPALSRLQVRAGESLWEVAAAHPVDGLTTSQVADLLAEANHLEKPLVTPGQSILVPATSMEQRFAAR